CTGAATSPTTPTGRHHPCTCRIPPDAGHRGTSAQGCRSN
ncbi:MAG: hypothetical protein AVDCRST_MAG57-3079, partial [uncultured Blastococcus sp.]